MEELLSFFVESFEHNTLVKFTLSKPRQKLSTLKNVYVRPIVIKKKLVCQFTYRNATNDVFKNFNLEEAIVELKSLLEKEFFFADLIHAEGTESLKMNSQGEAIHSSSQQVGKILNAEHNREKIHALNTKAPYWYALGITNSEGVVHAASQKKFKQVAHYIDLFEHLIAEHGIPQNAHIADFGCGKGYLTFALYDFLKNSKNLSPHITGYELRPALVNEANKLATACQYSDLKFEAKDINTVTEVKFDVLIALHACDIATDIAIAKGIRDGAKLILVAPCCHKQVRKDLNHTDERIAPILKYGILKERTAETLTDTIRALYLEYFGYAVKVQEFIAVEHTPKNVLITAAKSKSRPDALAEIRNLKAMFGLQTHYLETCLKDLLKEKDLVGF